MTQPFRTRAIAGVLALSVGLVLTSCGGGEQAEQVAADADQTLTVWAMGEEGQELQEVADAYHEEHPNVTIKVTPIGWDVAHQKLVSAAAGGELPDVAQMGSTFMGEFIDLDVLEPVDTESFSKDDFFDAAWEGNVEDGEVYGVPWYVDTRVLYYRTDLAEKAGITEAPTTWSDQLALATAYRDKAGTKYGASIPAGGEGAWQAWLPFLYSAGGTLLDKDGQPQLDSPESVRAFTEYAKYFEQDLVKKSAQPGYDVIKDFGADRVPMFPSGPWMVNNIEEQLPKLKGKWDVVELPGDEQSTSFVGGASLVTFSDSAHKAAAKDFIEYLSAPKQQVAWYERNRSLPANEKAWDDAALQGDELEVFRKTLENAGAVPPLAQWSEFASKIDDQIQAIAQKGKSPKDAAADAQEAVQGLVD